MAKMEPFLIGQLVKNATQDIRVHVGVFNDKAGIDVRVHYEADDGSWKPTKKGVWLAPDMIMGLLELLEEARAYCLEKGLYKPEEEHPE